jgi:hypothetical protein
MPAPVKSRRLTTVIALLLCITPLLGVARAAAIQSQLVCTPEQDPTQRFCVSYDAQVGPTLNARDPFDLDVTIANASANSQTDTSKWVDTVTLHLLGTNVSTPGITPSRDLPNNLVIAGDDGDCTEPTFTNCDAGHGAFVFNVSGSPLGVVDGNYAGHFGIVRIVNVNDPNAPPPAGTYSYQLLLDICVPVIIGSCTIHVTQPVLVSGSVAAAQGSGSVDFTFSPWQSGDMSIPCGVITCNIHYKGTLDSASLHMDGTSNTLQGGASAGGPFTIFTLPFTCGSATGSATFTTHQNQPRSVTVTQPPLTLVGCPTGAFSPTTSPTALAVEKLDASASSVGVGGRTIGKYRWSFGDGKTATTTGAVTTHAYPAAPESPSTYTASLVVVDSAGALSAPVAHAVRGTATALFVVKLSATRMEALGNVLPRHGGKTVTVSLFRKSGTSFVSVTTKTVTLDARSRYTALFTRPAATTCKLVTRFPNDTDHLGSRAIELTHC